MCVSYSVLHQCRFLIHSVATSYLLKQDDTYFSIHMHCQRSWMSVRCLHVTYCYVWPLEIMLVTLLL